MMNSSPAPEERLWAILSHLSALAFGMGIVLPIVGWSEQRQKSRYASFQCLQALGYQSLGYTIWLLTYLVLVILLSLFAIFTAGSSQKDLEIAWVVVFLVCVFGLLGLYLLLPVIAAIACAFGRDFHYPVLGKRLARYLGYGSSDETAQPPVLNEAHSDRWVAAMGHFSVIIVFWGLLAPIATWILQGKRSTFLKFQSVQTMIYQAAVNLLYLAAMFLAFLGTIPMFALSGLESGSSAGPPMVILGLILFIVAMLVALLFLLVVPLFHILGQWAGYRVLKADNYHYPLLGKLVEKRMAKSYGVQEQASGSSSELLDSKKENT